MYHSRFKGNHYEIGYKWGDMLRGNGKDILANVPFPITEERMEFARKCRPYYEEFYPEILEEMKGIAEGQKIPARKLEAVLFSMYCIMPENKCTCFAFRDKGHIILGRNSDFLTGIEKLYMNCIYHFNNGAYSFQGNTTAFVEMEDGMNGHGLAIGLTSVYPAVLGYGMNAGMLLRYGLETCRTAEEFVRELERLPIASSQTFTVADRLGAAAVIECNSKKLEVQYIDGRHSYVSAVNAFYLAGMEKYRVTGIDDWNAEERYITVRNAFHGCRPGKEQAASDAIDFAKDVLSGKYGFICQYDRKTGKDTVWSVIYDVGEALVYRCEGNPSRKKFVVDSRSLSTPCGRV